MSRHSNKHWLREKEYYILKKIYYDLYYLHSSSAEAEINGRLHRKFWNEFCGFFNTAPKKYRKQLNRRQRAKAKQVLHEIMSGKEKPFEDNYRDCNWYW